MIFFLKKAIYILIFIALMWLTIIQANYFSPILLDSINTGGMLSIFYPHFLTSSYLFFYKNLNSFLLVAIFLVQYLLIRAKVRKEFFYIIFLLIFYLVNNILSFSGFYWNRISQNIFAYIYIGTFISINLLVLFKIFLIYL